MALIQVRVDDNLKEQASKLFEDIGLDLSTAIRMFLIQSVDSGRFPFEMYADETGRKMLQILREIQEESVRNGTSEMTLDEINEEIRLAREEMRNKKQK